VRASAQAPFVVHPWLARLTPIRTGLAGPATLQLTGIGFTTPSAVRLDGPNESGGTTEITTFAPTPTDTVAIVTLPATLANGLYDVRLVRTDNVTTNPGSLEVIPLISGVTVTQVASSGTNVSQIAITGDRLTGAIVDALVDGIDYSIDPTTISATEISLTLGRLLPSGPHAIAVAADGHLSHTIEFTV
jgi:hypothetical protein